MEIILDQYLDNALDMHLSKLRNSGVEITKAELIVKLMRIGLLKESMQLLIEEREQL
jgi:hypothetical protein